MRDQDPRPPTEKRYGLAVRIFLSHKDGEILLLQRSPMSRTNPGRWELPGGKVDDGERFDGALRREVYEETGLEVALDGPLGVVEQCLPGLRVIHLIILGKVTSGELRVSDEHAASAWVSPGGFSNLDLADWFAVFLKRYGSLIAENLREGIHE